MPDETSSPYVGKNVHCRTYRLIYGGASQLPLLALRSQLRQLVSLHEEKVENPYTSERLQIFRQT